MTQMKTDLRRSEKSSWVRSDAPLEREFRTQNSEFRRAEQSQMTQMNADLRRSEKRSPWVRSDAPFFVALGVIGATYIVLIAAMLVADVAYTTPRDIREALASEPIRFAIKLSLISCTVTAGLSVIVGVPLGYLLSSRGEVEGRRRGFGARVLWLLRVAAGS